MIESQVWKEINLRQVMKRLPFIAVVILSIFNEIFPAHANSGRYHAFRKGMDALQREKWHDYRNSLHKEQDPDLRMALEIACHATSRCPTTFKDVVGRIRSFPLSPYLQSQIRRAESLALDADLPPGVLISWLSRFEPNTAGGWLAYVGALEKLAQQHGGTTYQDRLYFTLKKIWRNEPLTANQEKIFLQRYGQYLERKDHEERLEAMLWRGAGGSAIRQSLRVRPVLAKRAEARLALQLRKSDVDSHIQRVPQAYHDEGLAYDRVVWRWKGDKKEQAIALALAYAQRSVAPDKWLSITLEMVNYLLFRSRVTDAEKLLRTFDAKSIEKMSSRSKYRLWSKLGKIILIWQAHSQNFPQRAATQQAYKRATVYLEKALSFASSLEAKTDLLFWLGVAHERLGDLDESNMWYKKARDFGVYFYGQVAAKKLRQRNNIAILDGNSLSLESKKKSVFLSKPLVRLVVKLHKAEAIKLSRTYLHHLIDYLQDPTELGLAVQLAYDLEHIDVGIRASRAIEQSGMFVDKRGYPWLQIEKSIKEPSLIMALVRQESSFNAQAKSSAGARGLMQIMPNTAKYISSKTGKHYNLHNLTSDPLYNIDLGSWYLHNMLDTFDHHLVLALAGYNAGPGAVRNWLEKMGGVERNNLHSITAFIEKIPYHETKRYVKKVLANHTIYRILKEKNQNAEIMFSLR